MQYLKDVIRNLHIIQPILNNRRARLLINNNRVDIIAADFAHLLHRSDITLRGKSCLEIGSGWILSHTLVMHLLGAKRIVATDIISAARPNALKKAFHRSELRPVRQGLSPFEEESVIRARWNKLQTINFRFDSLAEIGIDYIAPIDLAKDTLPDSFDFIFSHAVIEHVSVNDVPIILTNLAAMLNPGGYMIHHIDLADHRDNKNNPYAFLSEPDSQFSPKEQLKRGNRLRPSFYMNHLSSLENIESRILFQFDRPDAILPDIIDPSVKYTSREDLHATEMAILSHKKEK